MSGYDFPTRVEKISYRVDEVIVRASCPELPELAVSAPASRTPLVYVCPRCKTDHAVMTCPKCNKPVIIAMKDVGDGAIAGACPLCASSVTLAVPSRTTILDIEPKVELF